MRRRLYYLLPDVHHTRRAFNDLLLARIDDRHIHVLAKEGTDLGDLDEATMSEKSDVVHGMELGLIVGAVTGIVAGVIAYYLQPSNLAMGIGAVLGFAILGAFFGVWVSGMIGSDVPNSQLKAFDHDIATGKVLLMVDVPREKVDDIGNIMRERHPEARHGGVEPTMPAFP